MTEVVLKYHKWQTVELCKSCGVIVLDKYGFGSPPCCDNCGAVDKHVLDVYITTRRFCTTYNPPWYKPWGKEKGYWEWSGKVLDDSYTGSPSSIPTNFMVGRRLSNTPTVIAAAGVASGLF